MPDIPTRLIVISARVPEGERCDGCEFYENDHGSCDDPTITLKFKRRVMLGYRPVTNGLRLPACRERDGWVAYPPGSGVAELVEAAIGLYLANKELRAELKRGRSQSAYEAAAHDYQAETARVIKASRKVAKEAKL